MTKIKYASDSYDKKKKTELKNVCKRKKKKRTK